MGTLCFHLGSDLQLWENSLTQRGYGTVDPFNLGQAQARNCNLFHFSLDEAAMSAARHAATVAASPDSQLSSKMAMGSCSSIAG